MSEKFLIEKRGLYYRPDAAGYTCLKRDAGRYSLEEAVERVGPNGPEGPQDGMGMWRESEAPLFSQACAWDVRLTEKVRAETIERCAKIAEDHRPKDMWEATECGADYSLAARHIADAIRAEVDA